MKPEESKPQQPAQLPEDTGSRSTEPYTIRFYMEEPTGDVYRAEALSNTLIRDVAADFFEERGWPTRDQANRPQRAVVERVDRDNPERTQRLRADETLEVAGVQDDDTLRIHPESLAGLVSRDEHLSALVLAYRDMRAFVAEAPDCISIAEQNSDYHPTRYVLTFADKSMKSETEFTCDHRVELVLPADYPLVAPRVRWLTPIFHPNISPTTGHVCLGVLEKRYMPGVGLGYIARMLRDIVQYRNYDLEGVLHVEAAQWAQSPDGQQIIQHDLGGIPLEQPIEQLLDTVRQTFRESQGLRVTFTRYNRFQQEQEG